MSAYVVQISYYEETYDIAGNVIDRNPKQIILGSIEDVRVSGSNELTTHPVANGTMVADHSIKQPISMTITGKASLNGSNDVYVVGSQFNEKGFESAIEKLKQEAWPCTITKWNMVLDRSKFLSRSNMILTSFDWTEGINTLGFSLTFNEIFMVDTSSQLKVADDVKLPTLTEPLVTSFSNTFMKWDEIGALVTQILEDKGLMTEDFKNLMISSTKPELISAGIAAGVGIGASVAGGIAAGIYAACGATGPIGWIVGAAVTMVAAYGVAYYFIGKAIYNAIDAAQKAKKYKIAQFDAYSDDEKNRQEVERFTNFIGEICLQLQELDKEFEIYQLTSNEEQEALVTLGNNNYIFKFNRNNVIVRKPKAINPIRAQTIIIDEDEERTFWYMTVYDQQLAIMCSKNIDVAKNSFDECSSTNALFRTSGLGKYVFLCRSNTYNTDRNDLRNYAIVATKIKPEEFMDRIKDVIHDALTY